MKLNFFKNKEVKNAGWLIGGKIAQMLLSLVVGTISARYLGPSNYGLIGYGNALVSFFMSFCTLGINSIIVKNFFDHPEEKGETLGSAILLRILSSICSAIMVISISLVIDHGERETILVVALCSISLIFHCLDSINYYFQSLYKSKITAMAIFIAYVATSVYKIILLIFGANVFWFAFASSVDYIVLAIVLLIAYHKSGGPQLGFSWKKGFSLLKVSYHYILSGLMVAIYGHTDSFMLKHMLNESEVGYYTIATSICAMWTFILSAIIDSMYPTIIKHFKDNNQAAFERKNRQLYAIVFYVSAFVSVMFLIFGELVIWLLYGKDFLPAAAPLRVITWYTAFSYFGVARNAWMVCNEKQKYLKFMYIGAAIINVGLNLIFIPLWGAAGAAFASLVTQISTSIILPLFIKDLRPNAKLMLEAIILKGVLPSRSKKNKQNGE